MAFTRFCFRKRSKTRIGALAFLLVLAIWMGKDIKTILAVFLAGLFPIIIELINTAETIIDLVLGPIYRRMSNTPRICCRQLSSLLLAMESCLF